MRVLRSGALKAHDAHKRLEAAPSSLSDLMKFKKQRQYAAVNGLLYTSCCGRCVGRFGKGQTNV
jgi:hypothetical protein